jgi:hypothetical protein
LWPAVSYPELIAVWKDPEFDANQSAFYYARVIEIPIRRRAGRLTTPSVSA